MREANIADAAKRQIDNAIGRTWLVAEMDKNQVRRAAKLEILKLLAADITATLEHI